MKFKPLHDRILVSRFDVAEKTSGGIFIPEMAKEKPLEGKVIAVGPGKRDDEGNYITPDVKVGDRVIFYRYGASEIKLDDKEYVILKEADIIGVFEE
ncbi:MAG: co-chaperone GroES [Smithella sp.]